MDEDFKDVYSSNSKLTTIVIVSIILGLVAFGYFFVYSKYKFTLKTIKHEIGTPLSVDVNDYLRKKLVDTAGYKLDTSGVNTSEVGIYEYKIKYNKIVKKGKIQVLDTTPPDFKVKDKIEVEAGDVNFYLSDTLSSCTDASMPCFVNFSDESDSEKLNTPGEYDIDIIVEDLYKNSKTSKVHITVFEKGTLVKDEEKDLEFASSSSPLTDFNDDYYVKFDKAIADNTDEIEDIISSITTEDMESYVNSNYPGFRITGSEVIKMHNKSNYVIGLVVKLTISNGSSRVVYMKK